MSKPSADIAARIARLSPEQRERFERLLQEKQETAVGSNDGPTRRTQPRTEFPLSFAQERIWCLHRQMPGSPYYNLPILLRLEGTLDVAALEDALTELVRRHEVFRTTFPLGENGPIQHVHPLHSLTLTRTDLRPLTGEDYQEQIQRHLDALVHAPFNLETDLLLRAALFQTGSTVNILGIVLHNIIYDCWSEGVLTRELGSLYAAFSAGQPSPLNALEIQYADYVVWQREAMNAEVLVEQRRYWQSQLSGAPTTVALPTDRPRPVVPSYRGAIHRFSVSPELTRSLDALARADGITLFITLLAAVNVMLLHYSGQEDIVVGTLVGGRTQPELEALIGHFTNTLALRTDLGGNPNFVELLRRVREVAWDAFAHQELPFANLVEELMPQCNISHAPLFQVMLVMQNYTHRTLDLPGLRIEALHVDSSTAQFDLLLSFSETSGPLSGSIQYNTDLFATSTIRNMAEHLQNLLASIVQNPNQTLSSLTDAMSTSTSALELDKPKVAYVAPTGEREQILARLWSEVLGIARVGAQDNYFELGGNSLSAARLFLRMEQEFGVRLPLSVLFRNPTIAALAPLLQRETRDDKPWPCLVELQPKGERPPFFCVHPSAANALEYRLLAQHIGQDQPVYGFQAQGLDGLQAPLTSVEEMASRYIAEMRTVQPKGPYRLGGRSGGDIIAFEMAQQLVAAGEKVALLALIDSKSRISQRHPIIIGGLLAKLDFHLGTMLYWVREKPLIYLRGRLRQQRSKLWLRLSEKGVVVVKSPYAGLSVVEKLMEENKRAVRAYQPRSYRGRITQIMASEMWYRTVQDRRLGWTALAEEGLEVHFVSGNHQTMMEEPYVSVLAATLRDCLNRAL